jgi:uroporphyrinogen III methyltransferase/synthase
MKKDDPERMGHVALIGAGPGHPGLITLEAIEALRNAQAVVFDRLANQSFLQLVPDSADRIDVGKAPGRHSRTQEQINDILVKLCREGKNVARLKGGDPLIFGRGGEEAIALRQAGCPFSIIPGLTAAIAAGAYGGIPLTHRGVASTVGFITGHEDPAKAVSAINYEALAGIDTLVFYMGMAHLPEIADRLIAAGRNANTPAALVERASQPSQRVITGDLACLPALAEEHNVRPPALIIVGEVVALRDQIDWRGDLPLSDQTIIVTRPVAQATALARQLVDHGARVIEAPSIEIRPVGDKAALDTAVGAPAGWWVFTSANGVEAVMERVLASGRDVRSLAHTQIAAIGSATAAALARFSLRADLLPAAFTTRGLAEAMTKQDLVDKRVVLFRADLADESLARDLREAGAMVETVVAYHIHEPTALPTEATDALAAGEADWVTVTSAATVRSFVSLATRAGLTEALGKVRFASIGPVTTTALEELGFSAEVTAEPCTVNALAAAIEACGL